MSPQLTQKQTDELFKVCKNNAVYHYDVQMEMVDHLASSIEEIWETEPKIDFKTAQKQAILKFGKGSFTRIHREKEKELRKKYNRMLWKYVFEFYRFPKIIMTFVFTAALFLLFQSVEQTRWIMITYFLLLLVAVIIYHFVISPKFKVKTDVWRNFLLLDHMKQIVQTYFFLFMLPNFCYQTFNMVGANTIQNKWILLVISFLMVFFNVILYAHFFYIPQRIREHFIETYPQLVKQ